MRAIAWLLRIFCYLFHLLFSLALLALGSVAFLSDAKNLKLEILPWQGAQLNQWLLGLGVVGLSCVILAVFGRLRFLLTAWALAVLAMLVSGTFLSPAVTFAGPDEFHQVLWLIGGALLAFLGSLTLLGRRGAGPRPAH